MPTAYLFDLDGTLVDSMTNGWVKMLQEFSQKRGKRCSVELIKEVIALGLTGAGEGFKEKFGLQESVEEIVAEFISTLKEKYEKEIPAKSGVADALRALKSRGASLNVLTASPHVFLDPCIKRLGLYDLFDNLWSVEDFPVTKADPLIYKLASKRLGKRIEECAMVDDSIAVIRSAKQSGIYTIGVYDEFSSVFEKEMREESDKYILNFSALI